LAIFSTIKFMYWFWQKWVGLHKSWAIFSQTYQVTLNPNYIKSVGTHIWAKESGQSNLKQFLGRITL
jgi:hypothetical protein